MTHSTQPTQPLRDEHRELLPYMELFVRVADDVGMASIPADSLLRSVDEVLQFLTGHLLPHAYAEERALYPLVGTIMGTPEATATMSRDHAEIERLCGQLSALRKELSAGPLNAFRANELRRLLYGLYTLVKVHFAKEEEVYLPLLDRKATPEQMRHMFEEMEKAADEARRGAVTTTV